MDAHQMDVTNVAALAGLCDESQQKAHHHAVVFDDAGQRPELVEEDGMSEGAGVSTPPSVDDLHDVVVISFLEGTGDHCRVYSTLVPSSLPACQDVRRENGPPVLVLG